MRVTLRGQRVKLLGTRVALEQRKSSYISIPSKLIRQQLTKPKLLLIAYNLVSTRKKTYKVETEP